MSISKFVYETVPGYFAKVSDEIDTKVVQVLPRFGLIDSSPSRWETFKAKIKELNKSAPEGTSYKVIFLGRHGQGYHNVAESLYGSVEWNTHRAKLNGDENMTWGPDPKLTDLGIQQAWAVNEVWVSEVQYGIPLPQSLYSSPFTRALHTAAITFDGIVLNTLQNPKRPLIKEKLREINGVHTCDKRSSRSHIAKSFPNFDIELNFAEEDELWTSDHRETEEELTIRLRQALDEIFSSDPATYVSITAHGGAIRAMMRVLSTTPFQMPTGGVVCFVVKVTGPSLRN